MLSMITQTIEGASMEFLIRNSMYVSEEVKNVYDDHNTFIERFQEDVIDRRRHHTKGMVKQKVSGTMGTTQTRNQACCSR